MDFIALLLPGSFVLVIFASHLLGLFSKIPLWSIGILTSTFPMIWFCMSVPIEEWEEAMMIIGGYAIMFVPLLGGICYKVAKFARRSAQSAKQQAELRATYGRRS
jgi:hypothetical protein